MLAYYSSASGNTERLIQKVGLPSIRIPAKKTDQMIEIEEPFILVAPTYARGDGSAPVPGPIIRFLNLERNRGLMLGVVGCGNRNFGSMFCVGARIISFKCNVPILHTVELSGVASDVTKIKELVRTSCKT